MWCKDNPKDKICKKEKKTQKKHFYIPLEQLNPAQFFFFLFFFIDRKCRKVTKSYFTEMKGTIFLLYIYIFFFNQVNVD